MTKPEKVGDINIYEEDIKTLKEGKAKIIDTGYDIDERRLHIILILDNKAPTISQQIMKDLKKRKKERR